MARKKTVKIKPPKKQNVVLGAVVKTEKDATDLVVALKKLLQSTDRVIVTVKCQIEGLLDSGKIP